MKTLTDWLIYLETLHPKAIDMNLGRINKVAAQLNLNLGDSFIITVTGTNGKGSTVRLLENILLNANFKLGAYTSPHLIKFNERIRINGKEIADELLCESLRHIEAIRRNVTLTYFEFTTLAALLLFSQCKLNFIILEVGLGGRLDATNIIDADLALITNIALDHCEWLGETVEKIAHEKAGIIKKNKMVCFGEENLPLAIKQKAALENAKLYYLGKDFSYQIKRDSFIWNNSKLPKPFIHPANAALVLKAIDILKLRFEISNVAIEKAIITTQLPGRLQYFAKPYPTLFDVAHNPHGIANLALFLQQNYPDKKIIAVFSILADKDLASILAIMQPIIHYWYIAELRVARAASLITLQETFKKLVISNFSTTTTIAESYAQALKMAQLSSDNLIVVFGSFHLIEAFTGKIEM